jgi:acyl carrier protein
MTLNELQRPVLLFAAFTPQSLGMRVMINYGNHMTDRSEIYEAVAVQIAPFNKKNTALTDATTFQGDLELDSLTVMDFVAAIEDEFDIMITMNMQAEIETVGELVDAVAKLLNK